MPEALKDIFFTDAFYADLAAACQAAYPPFDAPAFLKRVQQDGALKEQMRQTTLALHDFLPGDYRAALDILRRVLHRLDGYGFEKLVFPDYVELYGLDDWDASIPAFEEFTQQMSAEFAVRPFILKYPERMMAQMLAWAHHPSEQVRRLASEGCRPRLPWAMALPLLKADPAPILPILEQLKNDASETVRRSVANNLNDIAKDNPQVVVDVLARWQTDDSPDMRWMVQHALRTLIKKGHPGALALVGYGSTPAVTITSLTVEPDPVARGADMAFSFVIESTGNEPQDLLIDYVLHFKRANGTQSPKVFKLTKRRLAPGETASISRKHSFREITTRTYYPGAHAVAIQVNGCVLARQDFTVT